MGNKFLAEVRADRSRGLGLHTALDVKLVPPSEREYDILSRVLEEHGKFTWMKQNKNTMQYHCERYKMPRGAKRGSPEAKSSCCRAYLSFSFVRKSGRCACVVYKKLQHSGHNPRSRGERKPVHTCPELVTYIEERLQEGKWPNEVVELCGRWFLKNGHRDLQTRSYPPSPGDIRRVAGSLRARQRTKVTGDDWREGKTVLECNAVMLENEIACDVAFEVGLDGGATETIRAHKYMLVARSRVFHSMFWGELREPDDTRRLRVPDLEPATFRDLLRYIYCESIQLTAKKISRLMYASEKYILPDLTSLCESWMSNNIDRGSVCDILACAAFYNRRQLASQARDYIFSDTTEVLRSRGFLSLPQSLLQELLCSDHLWAAETKIFSACLDWAKQRCLDAGAEATGPTMRKALGQCLYLIRFPLIEGPRFVDLMEVTPGILSDEDEKAMLRSYITGRAAEYFLDAPRMRSTFEELPFGQHAAQENPT